MRPNSARPALCSSGWKIAISLFSAIVSIGCAGGKGREMLEPVAVDGSWHPAAGHRKTESTTRVLHSDIRRQSRSRNLSLVTKANSLSTVHRAGYLDYVGIKQFDAKGRLIGERRFLGLWTSAAYNSNPREIPLLRQKIAQVAEHFALAPDSHDGKALQHILESFPRDELFQASVAGTQPHRHRNIRPAGTAAGTRAVAPRSISPLLFLPGVRAAREIQHSGSPANRAGDTRSVLRVQHGVPSANRGVESGAHPHRRPNRADRELRMSMPDVLGAPRRRGRALMAGFLQGCVAGAFRRGLRPAAVRQVCAGISRRLHGGFPRRRRGFGCVLPRSRWTRSRRACTWTSTGRTPSARRNSS